MIQSDETKNPAGTSASGVGDIEPMGTRLDLLDTSDLSQKQAPAPQDTVRLSTAKAVRFLEDAMGVKTSVAALRKLRIDGRGPTFTRRGASALYAPAALADWAMQDDPVAQMYVAAFEKEELRISGVSEKPQASDSHLVEIKHDGAEITWGHRPSEAEVRAVVDFIFVTKKAPPAKSSIHSPSGVHFAWDSTSAKSTRMGSR